MNTKGTVRTQLPHFVVVFKEFDQWATGRRSDFDKCLLLALEFRNSHQRPAESRKKRKEKKDPKRMSSYRSMIRVRDQLVAMRNIKDHSIIRQSPCKSLQHSKFSEVPNLIFFFFSVSHDLLPKLCLLSSSLVDHFRWV